MEPAIEVTKETTKKTLKIEFKYCNSVAYEKSKLFRSHMFKVIDDKDFILKAFNDLNGEVLEFYENFYLDMLKTDRRCERDLLNDSSIKRSDIEIIDRNDLGETQSMADLYYERQEGISAKKSAAKKLSNQKKKLKLEAEANQ